MNIFVTHPDPITSAKVLPDKHVVKMPLETCQMLSIVFSKKWGHGYGQLYRINGEPYKTEKGAFRNHPCTVWANESLQNTWWLAIHGFALCEEYAHRYGKDHSCKKTLLEAVKLLPRQKFLPFPHTFKPVPPTSFVRAMPDEYKHDTSIDTFTAYKNYIRSKPWVASNYLRDPSRKPDWI